MKQETIKTVYILDGVQVSVKVNCAMKMLAAALVQFGSVAPVVRL